MNMKDNDLSAQREQAKQEIEEHAIAVYSLLPSTLAPYGFESIEVLLKEFKNKYEKREWRQVFYILLGLRSTNNFSSEICRHIEELDRLYNLCDGLGVAVVLSEFNDDEKRVVGECLHASAYGPFFDDCEVHTLFGAYRDEIIQLAKTWPTVKSPNTSTAAIINNAFGNLLGYPHRREKTGHNIFLSLPKNCVYFFTSSDCL